MEIFLIFCTVFILWCLYDKYNSVLKKAKQDADILLNNAQKRATSTLRKAHDDESNIIKNAQSEAARIVKKAKNEETQASTMIQEANGKIEFVDKFLQSKIKDFPIVAGVIADLETAIDKKTEDLLLHKPRKAVKASIELAKIRETKRILIAENTALNLRSRKFIPMIRYVTGSQSALEY